MPRRLLNNRYSFLSCISTRCFSLYMVLRSASTNAVMFFSRTPIDVIVRLCNLFKRSSSKSQPFLSCSWNYYKTIQVIGIWKREKKTIWLDEGNGTCTTVRNRGRRTTLVTAVFPVLITWQQRSAVVHGLKPLLCGNRCSFRRPERRWTQRLDESIM